MKKWIVKYTSWVCIEVEAENEDLANDEADRVINEMTGADFRECTDWETTEEDE